MAQLYRTPRRLDPQPHLRHAYGLQAALSQCTTSSCPTSIGKQTTSARITQPARTRPNPDPRTEAATHTPPVEAACSIAFR
jgi:hypothetical protein